MENKIYDSAQQVSGAIKKETGTQRRYKNVIIGFGKAGRALAKQLSLHGEEVLIIERDKAMYGGTCPNVGCLPSKSLILSGNSGRSWETAIARRRQERELLRHAASHGTLDEPLVDVLDGVARFIDSQTVQVTQGDGSEISVSADKIFINTGAKPVIPDIKGVDSPHVITSEAALDLDTLPREFVIIGAGYVGLEFAGMYHSFGAHVTLLEPHSTFLPKEDADVAAEILKDLRESGIEVKLGVQVDSISEKAVSADGKTYPADKVLIATGRKPAVDELALEKAGIERTETGYIKVDDTLKTTADNVWALGDVRGGGQFYYLSTDDFRIIANQLWGDGKRKLSDRTIVPYSVFLTPTFSRVGLDEKQAQAAGISYRLFKMAVSGIVKTKIIEDNRGLMKALVNPETGEILGATLYAPESHETINLVALAMKMHTPFSVLANQIFTHPTFSEGLNDLFLPSSEKTV